MLDEGDLNTWTRGRVRLRHLARQLGEDPAILFEEIHHMVHHKKINALYVSLGQPKYAWMATDNAAALYKAWKAKLS